MLGTGRRITINKETTTIVAEGNEQAVKARCDQIKKQMDETDSSYDKEKLQERLAKLAGGVAVIKVGAATETEMKDKKLRLEDAINATKAAVEEGIVPGGGTTLAHLSPILKEWADKNLVGEELIGANIVEASLTAPLMRIAENAGSNGAVIAENVKTKPFNDGFNAATGEYVDMSSGCKSNFLATYFSTNGSMFANVPMAPEIAQVEISLSAFSKRFLFLLNSE